MMTIAQQDPTIVPEHQQRVIAECDELSIKLGRLLKFTRTATFADLDAPERSRLSRQVQHMTDYRGVLNERIDAFQRGPVKTSGHVELDNIGNDKSNWDGASPAITAAGVKTAVARAAAAAGLVYADVHVEIDICTLEVAIIFEIGGIKRGFTTGGKITKNRTIDNLAQVAVARVIEWANDPMAVR